MFTSKRYSVSPRWLKRSSMAAILAVGGVALAATTASAVVIDNDSVQLGNVASVASFNGDVIWDQTVRDIKVTVRGKVAYNSSVPGCARVRVNIYDAGGTRISGPKYGPTVCGSGKGAVTGFVSVPRALVNPHRVRLTTQVKTGTTWANVNAQNRYLGDVLEGVA